MIACLDIGNTSTSYGIHTGKGWKRLGFIPTRAFPHFVDKILKNVTKDPGGVFIFSSTVPKISLKLRVLKLKNPNLRLFEVGKNLSIPINHKYISISKLGKDRLVNAYGAVRIYGAPILIFDYGTALTCDFVSQKRVFEGGLIIPGPEIAFNALTARAALLPKIPFPNGKARLLLGRDTKAGMTAGILQGYGAMTDGLIERFRRNYGRHFKVVATGGLAKTIYPYTTQVDILDPLLTLESLARIFKDQVKK